MRVLVATTELQASRSTDYCFTVAGELVSPAVPICANPRCGCARGFAGMSSSKATTTAKVVDLPHLTLADLRDAIEDWLERDGWLDLAVNDDEIDDAGTIFDEVVSAHVEAITDVSEHFPVGTVLERRGDLVVARAYPAAA